MDTRAARGLVSGVVLAVIGAILYYAVTAEAEGVDLDAIGIILMIAGAVLGGLGLVSALTAGLTEGWSRRRHVERRSTPSGTVQEEERERAG